MEFMVVKNEENQPAAGRRRISVADGEVKAVRCVKRRRRDPAAALEAAVLSCGDNNQSSQQQQQADQTSPATTTVKRSSKFRGVSRYVTVRNHKLFFM